MIMLYYQAGAGDNNTFQECIEPGQSGSYPIDDETFSLPVSLRGWNIQARGGDSSDPLQVGSKPGQALDDQGRPTGSTQPGPTMNAWASVQFYVNTDCAGDHDSPVVQFWEKTGKHFGIAVDDDGNEGAGFRQEQWVKMLQQVLVPVLGKALTEGTRKYSADDLDADTNGVWRAVENDAGPSLTQLVRDNVGGDYFCGPGYQRGRDVTWTEPVSNGVDANGVETFKDVEHRGKCPPLHVSINDVGFADAGIASARANVFAAQQNAKAAVIAAQAELDKSRILAQASANPSYLQVRELEIRLQESQNQLDAARACASNSNCTVVVGVDAGVNVGKK